MKSLSLPSLETLQLSSAADIFSIEQTGKFKLYSFIDIETLEFDSSNNPAFNIDTESLEIVGANLYLNNVDFTGYSRVNIGGSSKFKRIVSNQITASFDVNSLNNNMVEPGDGIETVKGTGQFLLNTKNTTAISSIGTGFINIANWNSNSTKDFILQDYQDSIFFDLNSDSTNPGTMNKPDQISIHLPENFSVGNVLEISYWFDGPSNNNSPNSFHINFEKQGTNDIQIITQFFGNAINSKFISNSNISIKKLDAQFSFNMLYLGNNFFNIKMNDTPFAGASSYEEKNILQDNLYNQWMMIEF